MLEVQKEALANRTRQRLVALREKELDYYTANCRMLGNQSALVSGFAYSAIRYHNWMEQQVPCCVSAVVHADCVPTRTLHRRRRHRRAGISRRRRRCSR